jgi:hypothetical protein
VGPGRAQPGPGAVQTTTYLGAPVAAGLAPRLRPQQRCRLARRVGRERRSPPRLAGGRGCRCGGDGGQLSVCARPSQEAHCRVPGRACRGARGGGEAKAAGAARFAAPWPRAGRVRFRVGLPRPSGRNRAAAARCLGCRARPILPRPPCPPPDPQAALGALLRLGRAPLPDVARACGLPPKLLRHALLVLLQHNFARAWLQPEEAFVTGVRPAQYLYEPCLGWVLQLLRWAKAAGRALRLQPAPRRGSGSSNSACSRGEGAGSGRSTLSPHPTPPRPAPPRPAPPHHTTPHHTTPHHTTPHHTTPHRTTPHHTTPHHTTPGVPPSCIS